MKNWEIIADNLSKAGFSWGCPSQIDSNGRELFTADAYSRDGRRFIVLSDDKLSAFMELEAAIRADESINQSESPAAGCTAFSGGRREFQ